MVTGAGGSIGSELCRQIDAFSPKSLLWSSARRAASSRSNRNYGRLGHGAITIAVVADILDRNRMTAIFDRFRPEVVFHAAAHKHVPLMESQPGEAFRNNTFGTVQLAELAQEFGVDRFVMISTDKAINPTNVMGTTKRLAEMFLQALHAAGTGRTKIMAVRFGNVLGSSGSVVSIFKKQIAAGGPVRVTHPDVTRYFMTIPEAVGLVLQSGAQGEGGEIFVLDMGKPVKIVNLARQMILLSGLKPDEDIAKSNMSDCGPGEKLFEELSYQGENIFPTRHPKIYRLDGRPEPLGKVRGHLEHLLKISHGKHANEMKRMLCAAVPEYQPFLEEESATAATPATGAARSAAGARHRRSLGAIGRFPAWSRLPAAEISNPAVDI